MHKKNLFNKNWTYDTLNIQAFCAVSQGNKGFQEKIAAKQQIKPLMKLQK